MARGAIGLQRFSWPAGSVEGLCRRLNSSGQHWFAEPRWPDFFKKCLKYNLIYLKISQ